MQTVEFQPFRSFRTFKMLCSLSLGGHPYFAKGDYSVHGGVPAVCAPHSSRPNEPLLLQAPASPCDEPSLGLELLRLFYKDMDSHNGHCTQKAQGNKKRHAEPLHATLKHPQKLMGIVLRNKCKNLWENVIQGFRYPSTRNCIPRRRSRSPLREPTQQQNMIVDR